VPALGLEMPGHRVAHHAEPEKRNLCHEVLPAAAAAMSAERAP
jgi:hypothetical protein